MNFGRRTLIRGIGAAGVSLAFTGLVSADGETTYLTRVSGKHAKQNLRRRGYTIEHELANGSLLFVRAGDDAETVASVDGVGDAVPDFRFELESPVMEEFHEELEDDSTGNGNGNESSSTDDTEEDSPEYLDIQWDKLLTEVPEAHEVSTGDGTRLAVIDTGIDHTHPDLGNVNTDLSNSIIGGDVGSHTGDVGYHGTHVAGTIGATGAVGVLGSAPHAELVSVRIFADDGGATFGDVLLAIDYATGIDADAANMSIGTPPIPPEFNAAQYRRIMEPVAQHAASNGTVLVGSAGNSDANLQQGGYFTLPNSLAGVVSVSATAPNDLRAFYSNYGTNEIDVGAPGGGYETLEKTLEEDPDVVDWPFPLNLILSTVPGGWGWAAGTSMAAPQVTGLVGIVRELDPDTTSGQVRKTIKAAADGVEGQNDADLGAGRVNARGCVEEMQ